MVYGDGTGDLPDPENDVKISTTPGTVQAATITYSATAQGGGKHAKSWRNCATLTSSGFLGTSYACVSGTIAAR